MAEKKRYEHDRDIVLPRGIEVDLDQAWAKLIENQFPGSAGRGFGELIQNFLDSYPATVPWKERRGEIDSGDDWISITDYGEGMDRGRLALIVTLGGTDKNDDSSKIGTFGVGFFSIFNPRLTTRQVRLVTRCEDRTVAMTFQVRKPGERPVITTKILKKKIDFSTRIKVTFKDPNAVELCLQHARKCLRYYPCAVTIDGVPHQSIWDQAKKEGAVMFEEESCHGFIRPGSKMRDTIVLCKYELVLNTALRILLTGGRRLGFNLVDFRRAAMPYLEDCCYTINCNDLNVTISRDSFSMDSAYHSMIASLARVLTRELGNRIMQSCSEPLIVANQYTLNRNLHDYFYAPDFRHEVGQDMFKVIEMLAQAKVYRLNGRKHHFSLQEIFEMKSDGLPLFYSPAQSNLHWLGGNFKHDFIVLPPRCRLGGGAPDLFDVIFSVLFRDSVNLDKIDQDRQRLDELIRAGIVDRESLHPEIEFQGERELTEVEKRFLEELNAFFAMPAILKVIAGNLYLPVKQVKTVFFEIRGQEAFIATGLFDGEGKALVESANCNLDIRSADGEQEDKKNRDIVLGLHRDHALIKSIINNNNPYRLYFALPILAHELALCQKQLVPYSTGYHLVKERLAEEMRQALMAHLLTERKAA